MDSKLVFVMLCLLLAVAMGAPAVSKKYSH